MTARTSQNDIERFESLYGANAKVRRRAVNSSSDVSDIVSEVFTTAWRRINDVPPFPQDRLWLFGVAHKCLLGHPRRWSHRLRLLSHLGSQPNRIDLLDIATDSLHLRVRVALQELRPLDRSTEKSYFSSIGTGSAMGRSRNCPDLPDCNVWCE